VGAEALRALSNLARVTGQQETSKTLEKDYVKQRSLVNETFWIADKKRFAFALDKNDKKVDEPSVLATVPMWFGLPSEADAVPMIQQLADMDHQTDWGMRINLESLAALQRRQDITTVRCGHCSQAGRRSRIPLSPDVSRVCESAGQRSAGAGWLARTRDGVLSGDYYQPLSTSSPHQIWSAAMVVTPLVRGMFGLETDAATGTLTLVPHVPADWNSFGIRNHTQRVR